MLVSTLREPPARWCGGCAQTSSVRCAECRDGPPLAFSPAAPPPAPHSKPPHCQLCLGWLIQLLPPPSMPCNLYPPCTHRVLSLNTHRILQTPRPSPGTATKSSCGAVLPPHRVSKAQHVWLLPPRASLCPPQTLFYPRTFAWAPPLPGILFPQLLTCLSLVHSNLSSGTGKFSAGR